MTIEAKDLLKKLEKLGTEWEEFKASNNTRLDALEKGEGTAEIDAKLNKLDESITGLVSQKEAYETQRAEDQKRMDELEAALDRKGPGQTEKEKAAAEYLEKFNDWIRNATEKADNAGERALALKSMEKKDVSIGTGAAGGFAVPEVIARQIHEQAQQFSPVRQDVRVVQVGTSDYKELIDIYGTTSGWAGETDTRNATNTPNLRERAPTMGTAYCYPAATEESMMDIFFDVPSWLTNHCAFELARQEGIAALTGDGSNKPTGLLNTAPTSSTDAASPMRDEEELQYLPLLSGSPGTFANGDGLMDMIYSTRAQYRVNGKWAMNSLTCGGIRKLKDANDNYLFAPGLQAGEPARLLGYPIRFYEDLADLAADSLSVLFGDFMRGYLLVDRGGLRISVDDNLTTPGYVKFYVRRRVGGILLDNNAIKVGKYSLS